MFPKVKKKKSYSRAAIKNSSKKTPDKNTEEWYEWKPLEEVQLKPE